MRALPLVVCLTLCAALPVPAARAQEAEEPDDVDEAVAKALFEQGVKLYHAREYADARALFLESLQRSPRGAYAASARQMVERCEERLGIRGGGTGSGSVHTVDEEPGLVNPYEPDDGEPLDPYGDQPVPDETETIQNPYLDDDPGAATGDRGDIVPGAPADNAGLPGGDRGPSSESRTARRQLVIFGGLYGLYTAAALQAAAESDGGGGALLLTLAGTGVGAGAAYYLTRDRELTEGQAMAVMSGAVWGTSAGLFFAHVGDDPDLCDGCDAGAEDQPDSTYFGASVATGAIGVGAGIYWATRKPAAGDVAFANSLAGYGLLGGLMLGVTMDPSQSRAYSLNAALGSTAGLVAGILLARKVDVSRRRMAYVDLGVGLGALASWVLVFPPLEGAENDAEIAGGFSLALMATGGYAAWWLTRKLDRRPAAQAARYPAPPAVVGLDGDGRWQLGTPILRPMVTPGVAAGGPPDLALGVDLVSGWF